MYADYLSSPHWRRLSRKTKLERGGRCELCNLSDMWSRHLYGNGLNVHHKTYVRIGHERPEDLQVICVGCHAKEHGLPEPEYFSGKEGWVNTFTRFSKRFRMDDITPLYMHCFNCGIETGPVVYNADETDMEWICWECRS